MRFQKFEIFNFKGIKHATINLEPRGADIFTLIGLNESGKTTILEAISKFQSTTDRHTALYNQANITKDEAEEDDDDPSPFVPKRQKANFSDSIKIQGTLKFESGEREAVISSVQSALGCKIEESSIPETIKITRGYKFQDSDYKEYINTWDFHPKAKLKEKRKFEVVEAKSEVWQKLILYIKIRIPNIVYFPTFLFNQPERIIISNVAEESETNAIYREIISNVAKSLQKPLDIKKHIVDRILTEESLTSQVWNMMMLKPDKQEQVTASLNEISDHLTNTIFSSWAKTFGGDFTGREVKLIVNVDKSKEGTPLVYAQFVIKDGTSQYAISEKSLGFKWFFSFLLFTLYKVSSNRFSKTLFLIDEPASNLHSGAQTQLLDSLPKIAKEGNQIVYSTHSHYLINPDWLDQAFIVSNSAIDYDSIEDNRISNPGLHTDITAEKYRSFVGQNPDKITYFQPVLDKLGVSPSRIDLVKPSILVEGKGDYVILEYVRKVILDSDSSLALVPTRGAAGMDELIGLFLGWAVPFVVCLDDDGAGRKARVRYVEEWGLPDNRVFTLERVDAALKGKTIEGMLEKDDLDHIAGHYGITTSPTKRQIQLFFSEMLAKKESFDCSEALKAKAKSFEDITRAVFESS